MGDEEGLGQIKMNNGGYKPDGLGSKLILAVRIFDGQIYNIWFAGVILEILLSDFQNNCNYQDRSRNL